MYNPEVDRTLAIIKRPGMAERGQRYNLIIVVWGENQHKFKSGHRWHIFRQRSAEEAGNTQEMRHQVVTELLDPHRWNKVDARCRGTR